jgi:hypothetical protein
MNAWISLNWKRIEHFFYFIKQLLITNTPPGVIFRIIDINPETLDAVIKCINTRTTLKDKIPHLIKDKDVIAGLAPNDACWLGYYYGQAVQNKSSSTIKKITWEVSFLMRNTRGKYRIHSMDRDGMISYLDTVKNLSYDEHPLAIAKNAALINQFDPSQACYIGVLSGLNANEPNKKVHFTKPNLRLVD